MWATEGVFVFRIVWFLIPLEGLWRKLNGRWMTRKDEEDSVAKETQQVEFIKPKQYCCCLFFILLHLKILHKRLLIKYNKLFSFHFEFVAYLKFPDLCRGIRRRFGSVCTVDNWQWNSFKKNGRQFLRLKSDLITFCWRITPQKNVNREKDEAVGEKRLKVIKNVPSPKRRRFCLSSNIKFHGRDDLPVLACLFSRATMKNHHFY